MGNPCGQVHMPNMPCRACDRVRAKAALETTTAIKAGNPELRTRRERWQDEEAKAVIETAEALTNAERQKRYRERHGDAYRKANRERMRRKREHSRGGA